MTNTNIRQERDHQPYQDKGDGLEKGWGAQPAEVPQSASNRTLPGDSGSLKGK
jgi:hypothetical protein